MLAGHVTVDITDIIANFFFNTLKKGHYVKKNYPHLNFLRITKTQLNIGTQKMLSKTNKNTIKETIPFALSRTFRVCYHIIC